MCKPTTPNVPSSKRFSKNRSTLCVAPVRTGWKYQRIAPPPMLRERIQSGTVEAGLPARTVGVGSVDVTTDGTGGRLVAESLSPRSLVATATGGLGEVG